MKNILILCTGNSARSILAECLVNRLGDGRYRGFSAGSKPAGKVNPGALRLLERKGFDLAGLRSKSWDEFAEPGAPNMDFVFTVCDNAANEVCPVWPGAPVSAHFGVPDPANVDANDIAAADAAFQKAWDQLSARIGAFMDLDVEILPQSKLKEALALIGAMDEGGSN